MTTLRFLLSLVGLPLVGTCSLAWTAFAAEPAAPQTQEPIALETRRELFVDYFLLDELRGARLALHAPRPEEVVLTFDNPWEGPFCGYCTILKDGDLYRLYYRGMAQAGADGSAGEVTCYAESKDGIHWVKPKLGLFEVAGSKENNVVLAGMPPFSHNFSPMIDTRPGVPQDERYKALAGTGGSRLVAFVSGDGLRWKKLHDKPVITEGAFDSQNVSFWSPSEECYLCYFRSWTGGVRRISRATSKDYLTWTRPELMEYAGREGPAPLEHLYTNQTQPYFRAPHIYVSTAARFMPGRQAITAQQAAAIRVHPGYFKDISDCVLQTSRGGARYDRTFMEGFIRPGIGPEHWVSRTNYPALGIVQTGPHEMSMYVQENYGQPTARLRRYSMRLDGFASIQAPYQGGEAVTKLVTFAGKRLVVNFSTSAAGSLRVEVHDAQGQPLAGFALADADELIGNEIERPVTWRGNDDLGALAGKPVRLRLVMKDADLYSLRVE